MWETVNLGDVCELVYGKALDKSKRLETDGYPAYGANGIKTYAVECLYDEPSIIVGRKGSAGELQFVKEPFWALDVTYYVKHDEKLIELEYLYHLLKLQNLPSLARGVKPGINRNDVYSISVQLPPLAEQQRIVAKLDAAFSEIDTAIAAAEKNAENAEALYESALTEIYFGEHDEPTVRIGDIASIKGGKRLPKGEKVSDEVTDFPYIRVSDFTDNGTVDEESVKYISKEVHEQISRYVITEKDVYVSIAGTIGKTGVVPQKFDGANLTENAAKIVLNEECLRDYFYFFTTTSSFNEQAIKQTRTAAQPKLALERLAAVELPLPSLEAQKVQIEKARQLEELREEIRLLYVEKTLHLNSLKSALLTAELTQQSEAA